MLIRTALAASAMTLVAACAGPAMMAKPFDQAALPAAIQVPAGHTVFWETAGVGQITYECRFSTSGGTHDWVFVGPDAALNDRSGKQVGKYYGPPATWESMDGTKLTATQVAVSPNGTANIPHQLVKANPATGTGAISRTTYIQRVATMGGVAPATACGSNNVGAKQTVRYQADYIFWRAA